jgi:hypothetical protein
MGVFGSNVISIVLLAKKIFSNHVLFCLVNKISKDGFDFFKSLCKWYANEYSMSNFLNSKEMALFLLVAMIFLCFNIFSLRGNR